MLRKIIHIDEEKCNGCGLCAKACHEGAIEMVNGKAKLAREHFCDGFGDCLPACPAGAISFEEREAPAYDKAAVEQARRGIAPSVQPQAAEGFAGMNMNKNGNAACPGSRFMTLERREGGMDMNKSVNAAVNAAAGEPVSRLGQWPCQIRLLPVKAPFYDGAKLLIAADCAAYAYANMHERFMKGKVTLIGCPKLDNVDYAEKLAEIIANNDVKGVTIVRMEVPCCGGLQRAAETALKDSGKFIPWQVVTLSRDGRILD